MSLLITGLTSLASLLMNAASSRADKRGSPRQQGESPDAGPAAKVQLSQEAQALAGLAGQGAMFAQAIAPGALTAVHGGAGAAPARAKPAMAVSSQDFQGLLERFGADAGQSKLLTAGFDTDQNGSISRAEFLQGLGRTAHKGGADGFSQALLQLMDRGGDANASVSKQEFAAFTTAFAEATRGRRA